jgi:hypothetical protein
LRWNQSIPGDLEFVIASAQLRSRGCLASASAFPSFNKQVLLLERLLNRLGRTEL